MPLNCPALFRASLKCTECFSHSEGFCEYHIRYPRLISEILTTEERLALLETPHTNKKGEEYRGGLTIYTGRYPELARVSALERKLNEHIDKSKLGRESKFNKYV